MQTKRLISYLSLALLALALAWTAVAEGPQLPSAPPTPPRPPDQTLVDQLGHVTGGKARISYHAQTGKVRFIGTDAEHPIPRLGTSAADAQPEQTARAFLGAYGELFGLTDQAKELTVMRTKAADGGRSFVRFQQVLQGVPVLGGELIVQMDANKNVVSANGEVLPTPKVNIVPTFSAKTAQQRVMEVVAKSYGLSVEALTVTEPELWIYNPILLGGPGPRLTTLAWRMEVKAGELDPVKELVLIDAHRGVVALHFNQIDTIKFRKVYDNQNNPFYSLPGPNLMRSEGNPATGNTDVDNAYDYGGDTYDFYYSYHSRDSLDNAGMQLISTAHYCSTSSPCPYANAFWNGSQMVYGQGYASADDVVGHEMTHGVTEHESHLFYYYQSGAINEAFSDIWGELIDQTNGKGNDTPGVKWLMGEDLPGGAIRSMSNPPAYGDPDRMGSPNYACGQTEVSTGDGDNGGVHTNSGVANKAAYLLVDGNTFNGKTVTGLGITKTIKIFYEVQTNLFTSASDYQDLYDALQQACTNLVGTNGITASDCQQVKNAVDATEMSQQPSSCPANEAPICASGSPSNLFFDNMEAGAGNWTHSAAVGTDYWYLPQNPNFLGWDQTYATSGNTNIWSIDIDETSDTYIAMNHNIALPSSGTAYLHFNHAFGFESTVPSGASRYDGGIVEYSTNGGSSWNDAISLFDYNGYNGTLASGGTNPLAGRQAFSADSRGYISSRLNLSSLAGQNVRFRFRIGTDSSGWDYGWFIDDVRIYTCGAAQPDVGITKQVIGSNLKAGDRVTFTLSIANTSSAVAANVVVTDNVPAQVSNPTYASTLQITRTGVLTYVWNVGTLGVGQSGVITIYGQIDPLLKGSFSFSNSASISDPQDNTPGNNTSSVTVGSIVKVYFPVVMNNWPPIVSHTYYAATDDTVLESAYGNTWYGSYGDFAVGYCTIYPYNIGIARSILRFNLASIPAAAYIKSATLQPSLIGYVYQTGRSSNMVVTAYRISQAWPGLPTWNNFANAYAESYGSATVSTSFVRSNIDVTALVQGWVNGTWPNYGMMLRGQEGSYCNLKDFASANGSSSDWPQLIVEYPDLTVTGTTVTVVIPAEPLENTSSTRMLAGWGSGSGGGLEYRFVK